MFFARVDFDECASRPCENGATCISEVNAYKCVCQWGFLGVNCEIGLLKTNNAYEIK